MRSCRARDSGGARRLAARLDAPAVFAAYSRLVIDCNRSLDHPTSILALSDGINIPGNSGLSATDIAARAEICFWSYHQAIDQLIESRLDRGLAPAIIAVHSFTPILDGIERPWQVGVLWNRDRRIAEPLIAALQQTGKIAVGDNQPYSGREHYGYSIEAHAIARGLAHVLIELREDLFGDEAGEAEWAGTLADGAGADAGGPWAISRRGRLNELYRSQLHDRHRGRISPRRSGPARPRRRTAARDDERMRSPF